MYVIYSLANIGEVLKPLDVLEVFSQPGIEVDC